MEENRTQLQDAGGHALLSPSSAARWLRCTPSPIAESTCPDETSPYAAEGTLAHCVAALTVLRKLGMTDTNKFKETQAELSELVDGGSIPTEMEDYATYYAYHIMRLVDSESESVDSESEDSESADVKVYVETKLDLGAWAPGSFGTADCIIVGTNRITVVDFKYGVGVRVDAERNPQMMMYALGALDEFGLERELTEVAMEIWQPRLNAFSRYEMTVPELLEWGSEHLSPLAQVAARGLGARSAGKWCRFCRAKEECPEFDRTAAAARAIIPDRQDARSLGALCLPMIPVLEMWIDQVNSRALGLMTAGEHVPGYTLGRKRSMRRISDSQAAAVALRAAGYQDVDIFKDAPLKSLGDLEKLVGKKKLPEILGNLIIKPEGELTIKEDASTRVAPDEYGPFAGIEID